MEAVQDSLLDRRENQEYLSFIPDFMIQFRWIRSINRIDNCWLRVRKRRDPSHREVMHYRRYLGNCTLLNRFKVLDPEDVGPWLSLEVDIDEGITGFLEKEVDDWCIA